MYRREAGRLKKHTGSPGGKVEVADPAVQTGEKEPVGSVSCVEVIAYPSRGTSP